MTFTVAFNDMTQMIDKTHATLTNMSFLCIVKWDDLFVIISISMQENKNNNTSKKIWSIKWMLKGLNSIFVILP